MVFSLPKSSIKVQKYEDLPFYFIIINELRVIGIIIIHLKTNVYKEHMDFAKSLVVQLALLVFPMKTSRVQNLTLLIVTIKKQRAYGSLKVLGIFLEKVETLGPLSCF